MYQTPPVLVVASGVLFLQSFLTTRVQCLGQTSSGTKLARHKMLSWDLLATQHSNFQAHNTLPQTSPQNIKTDTLLCFHCLQSGGHLTWAGLKIYFLTNRYTLTETRIYDLHADHF